LICQRIMLTLAGISAGLGLKDGTPRTHEEPRFYYFLSLGDTSTLFEGYEISGQKIAEKKVS